MFSKQAPIYPLLGARRAYWLMVGLVVCDAWCRRCREPHIFTAWMAARPRHRAARANRWAKSAAGWSIAQGRVTRDEVGQAPVRAGVDDHVT